MGRAHRTWPAPFGLLLLATALLVGCSSEPPPGGARDPAEDRVARGARVFAAACAECHGAAGSGGVGPAPALDASGHAWHHPDAQVREWITQGKLGLGSSMPALGDRLSDEEVEAVMDYVRTLWTEEQRRAQRDVSERYEEGRRRFQ